MTEARKRRWELTVRNRSWNWVAAWSLSVGLTGLVGTACGGDLREGLSADVMTAVTIAPTSATLAPSQAITFSATAQFASGGSQALAATDVQWSATGGAVNASGRYTAGASTGNFLVAVTTSQGDLADTAQVTITSQLPAVVGVTIAPGAASLAAGESVQFNTTATFADQSTGTVPTTYQATGGSITDTGLYTAASTPGSFRVVSATIDGAFADTADVTISAGAPTLTGVILSPASVTLETGATRFFSVTGSYSDGSTGPVGVTYAATGGTINGAGTYTAGSTEGSFQVVAIAAGGLADTAAVTIIAQGTFDTPDIMNNYGFESGYGPFVEVSSAGDHPVDCTVAYEGGCSLKNVYNPSMGGWVQTGFLGGDDEWYVRQYFRLEGTNSVDGQQKWTRLQGGNSLTTVGGVYLEDSSFKWSADAGLLNGFISGDETLWSISSVNDGQWHSLEFHFIMNGAPGNLPRVEFWLDGVKFSKGGGAWENVWLVYDGRGQIGGGQLQILMIHGHQNSPNSRSGVTWKDRVAISTHRIGP